jgi:hypothetical protein
MSKTSLFLLVIFTLTIIALLSLNSQYSSNPVLKSLPGIFPTQEVVQSENSLTLTPPAFSVHAGKSSTIQVVIDSKGEKPSLIQMELAYDPTILGTVKLAPGTFFSDPQVLLNNVNSRNGRISYAIAPSSDQDAATDSNIVATITITPSINAYARVTSLYFLPKTLVRTKSTANTLKIAYGTKITVSSGFSPLASPSAR